MLQLTTVLFLISGSLLAGIHFIALELYLYWSIWWFDIPMHFIGGSVVTLLVFALYDLRILVTKSFLTLPKVMSLVLLIAIIWEIYELAIGIPIMDDYVFDTVLDLLMGLAGGYVGYLVASRVNRI